MSRFKTEKLGVYGIFLKEECLYVGVGEIKDRESTHWSRCRHNLHGNKRLQKCWDENDGETNFIFKPLEYCTKNKFKKTEQKWMDELQPLFNSNKAAIVNYKTNTHKKLKIRAKRSAINSSELNPNYNGKLPNEDVVLIKLMFASGYGNQYVYNCFKDKTSYNMISRIKTGDRRASVLIEDYPEVTLNIKFEIAI